MQGDRMDLPKDPQAPGTPACGPWRKPSRWTTGTGFRHPSGPTLPVWSHPGGPLLLPHLASLTCLSLVCSLGRLASGDAGESAGQLSGRGAPSRSWRTLRRTCRSAGCSDAARHLPVLLALPIPTRTRCCCGTRRRRRPASLPDRTGARIRSSPETPCTQS